MLELSAKSIRVLASLMVLAAIGAGVDASAKEAVGTVFEDLDGDGDRGPGERSLEDVRVSNGREIVRTDASGRYALPAGDDTIVFVIQPAGWTSPTDENGLPRFHYVHKPAGSPDLNYDGVAPTGPLPESIDFALRRRDASERFRIVLFGDTQCEDQVELNYLAHDLVEELVGVEAAFGVTLGDLVNDDLTLYEQHNRTIGRIGIPWHNVVGNHDQHYDAISDRTADEAFERVFGPPYYSFDNGAVHFVILDDAFWRGPVTDPDRWVGGNYIAALGERQLAWLENDLALVPRDRLVVLMMHIPFTANWNESDRERIYELLAERDQAVSFAAHYHVTVQYFLDAEDGWPGSVPHHHFVAPTACGSWWSGAPDETGIPHATMSDGAPNGYCFVDFEGTDYEITFKAARRPADYQINIIAPELVQRARASEAEILANVFIGSERSLVQFRLGEEGAWLPMEQVGREDPYFLWLKELEKSKTPPPGAPLPNPSQSTHIWQARLPADPPAGTQLIHVRSVNMFGRTHQVSRVIRIQ